MWWLSVDNSYFRPAKKYSKVKDHTHASWDEAKSNLHFLGSVLIRLFFSSLRNFREKFSIVRLKISRNFQEIKPQDFNHLSQSRYAQIFIQKVFGVDSILINDYIPLHNSSKPSTKKRNSIAYNPAKGLKFTLKLLEQDSNLDFIPITGLNREGVSEVLSSVKIYLDLGHFPGRDRIPREAALRNCLVVARKKGSSNFLEDFPIPEDCRIDLANVSPKQFLELLEKFIIGFEKKIDTFKPLVNSARSDVEKMRIATNRFVEDCKESSIR
jgi:hypothetical protein